MISLPLLQIQVSEWSHKNFPTGYSYRALLGVAEEVGELCHAHLKMEQGIRNCTKEDKIDAIGDIIIFLCDYCSRESISLDDAIKDTWAKVRMREWK